QMSVINIDGNTITTRTFNDSLPGPMVRVRPGDTLRLRLVNNLPLNTDGPPADVNIPNHPNTANLHVHGLHVAPTGNSDNALIEIEPGTQFDYEFQIPADHPAGTFWYHPHRHGSVATQMFGGMAGPLIIEGGTDDVPEISAASERVLLFQEIRLGDDHQIITVGSHMFDHDFEFMFAGGSSFSTVNGVLRPEIRMAPGEVERWRLLNGNVTQYLNIEIEGHELHLIAWDGITLAHPLTLQNLELAPGNRADILVKPKSSGAFRVTSSGGGHGGMMTSHGGMGGGMGFSGSETVAYLTVEGEPRDMALPEELLAPGNLMDIDANEITKLRQLTLSIEAPTASRLFPRFNMDGRLFDPTRIDHQATLGDVEEWTIRNLSMMDHPIHIHTNPFQVVAINGQNLQVPRWSDTVNVPAFGSAKIRMRLLDYAGILPLHCHILTHEDLGMMQLMEIGAS
ncbi:MAG: multicopper oxidase domain-containing protein, partial [Candidatus Hydrogenedentes bacterium]|nr:multicopper oxidase domain-containing protein [Candidatus Hydrogenedentota bacterium]